jgi:hypothetical protein
MPAIALSIIAVIVFAVQSLMVRSPDSQPTRSDQLTFGDFISPTLPPSPSKTPSPSPTLRMTVSLKPENPASEMIECVGPDGIHFQAERKACDDLNAFWRNPNAEPVPESAFRREKADEHTTVMWLPPDDRMSTNEDLFSAINNYRRAHGIGEVAKATRCA